MRGHGTRHPSRRLPASPRRLGLPFARWRPGQREALSWLLSRDEPYLFLEAPTGAGKSLLGVAFARLTGARLLYVVHTRQLQEQLARDFPAAVIMGRANYPTASASHLTCDACELRPGRRHCSHCCSPHLGCRSEAPRCDAPARCPYLRARREAEQAEIAVTNTAYLLQDLEAGGNLADDRHLVVIDEADELPSALVQHLALEISLADLELLQMPPPADPLSPQEWSCWAGEVLRVLPERSNALSCRLDEEDDPGERARLALALRRLEMLSPRLERIAGADPASWVASCDDPRQGPFLLRPLWPASYASSLLWRRLTGRVLFMSATLLDAAALARELGLRPGSWAVLSLPSPIPPEQRPVRYTPVASLNHDNASASWPRALLALDGIISLHPHERGVVHTQSYRLARYVLERSRHRHRLVGHSSASERRQALEGHGARREAVLVSPSMQRGVDFAGDRARFAVVLKMPFPNLGDPWVAARLASPGGQEWYARETVRALVQACGRVCRGPDDYGITYILDSQFGRFLRRYRRLFPSWFLAALSDQDGAHNAFPGDDGLEQRLPRQEGDDPGDVVRPSASATATTALRGEG